MRRCGSRDSKFNLHERTKILESAGIGVIRFWNNDVLNSLDAVLEELHAQLMGRHTPSSALSGTFSLMEKEW